MDQTEEIILDIIKYMELDPDMIDICEDKHGNITIKKALKEHNHD